MTKEHLGVVLALEIPLIIVVTKIDMVPEPVLEKTKQQLVKVLKSPAANKMPIHIKSEADVATVLKNSDPQTNKLCPIFFISSVNGTGVELLHTYLSQIKPRFDWPSLRNAPTEFSIDESFIVDGVGLVVSGTLASGVLRQESTMLLGPMDDGSFRSVFVRSIHCKRVPVSSCEAGMSAAISFRPVGKRKAEIKRSQIRRGMVLLEEASKPRSTRFFESEVLVLHHPSTIKINYQSVIHCGAVRQTAQLVGIKGLESLRTGDRAIVQWRFLAREEFLHNGTPFIWREGSTKGVGRITKSEFTEAELAALNEAVAGLTVPHHPHHPSSSVSVASA